MKLTETKIMLLFALWGVAFFPVYPDLAAAWLTSANSDNSYGMFVPLISLYFIWAKRKQLAQTGLSNPPAALLLLLLSLLCYLASYGGGLVFLQRAMLVCSLNALVWYLFGTKFYCLLKFPLLYLIFAVPIPESVVSIVSFPLQTYATVFSTHIIQAVGIPVYREGHMLYFSQTQLEVAEACSGIRSMSAMLMLSAVFMHQVDNGRARKMIMVLSSVVIAFVANIVRVSGTGILAHFYGAGVARGFLHQFSGITVFVFGFLMMFALYNVVNRKLVKT